MCHSDDSRPPAPPHPGPVARAGQLTLVAADGTHLAGYEALPEQAHGVGVIILPDVRGLHPYYMALAERFAQAGLPAVAIDYFGRTDGVGVRGEDFDHASRIPAVTAPGVAADAAAAAARLRVEHGCHAVFSVGFCFGGGHSWRLAAAPIGLAGAIGFYGRPAMVEDVLDQLEAPLLMLIAGADAATPVEEALRVADRVSAAGVECETHVYDGAPHSFFDRAYGQWAAVCADAWERMLAFMDRHADRRG